MSRPYRRGQAVTRGELPPVYANVEARKNGFAVKLYVRIWEKLPLSWNHKSANDRQLWLEDFFRRSLHLREGDEILKVTIE